MHNRKSFNIRRAGFNFIVEPGYKDTRLNYSQSVKIIRFLEQNLKLFAYHFEEVKWYIKFLEKGDEYFYLDEESGLYSTWFYPTLYGENAIEKIKEIFQSENTFNTEMDNSRYRIYSKDLSELKKCTKKFYNVVVIPYIEELFGTNIGDIINEYKALSDEEKEILELYY